MIDQVEGDQLVTLSGQAIYSRWRRILKRNDLPHITFHDLRHVTASVMALLNIPEKYALERGGWKTPAVMKNIYQSTFDAGRIQADNTMDSYFNALIKKNWITNIWHGYDTAKQKPTQMRGFYPGA